MVGTGTGLSGQEGRLAGDGSSVKEADRLKLSDSNSLIFSVSVAGKNNSLISKTGSISCLNWVLGENSFSGRGIWDSSFFVRCNAEQSKRG